MKILILYLSLTILSLNVAISINLRSTNEVKKNEAENKCNKLF